MKKEKAQCKGNIRLHNMLAPRIWDSRYVLESRQEMHNKEGRHCIRMHIRKADAVRIFVGNIFQDCINMAASYRYELVEAGVKIKR